MSKSFCSQTCNINVGIRFIEGMVDSLNAEVSLGTVANIREAIRWIGYTYLFVRMRKNPMVYGKCPIHYTEF